MDDTLHIQAKLIQQQQAMIADQMRCIQDLAQRLDAAISRMDWQDETIRQLQEQLYWHNHDRR